jgi:hypothetical protein
MDTQSDFQYLHERVACRYNPYQEGEYLVIQSYPKSRRLIVEYRSFDYREVSSKCEMDNLGHDYTSFALRIFHQGKLWVTQSGKPKTLSEQQDWKIASEYDIAHYDENSEGQLDLCACSYPYYSAYRSTGTWEYWQPITCLEEDNGREFSNCPNCDSEADLRYRKIYEEPEVEENTIPEICIGCVYYHGDNDINCALHPEGKIDNCDDWEG